MLQPIKTQTRQERMRVRILDAGLGLFLQFGYRGVSMEGVAARAEVAKPTLYKYFSDKEALFRAGVARLIGEAKNICLAEFSRDAEAGTRIAGGLAAKHKMFFKLVDGSAFADEIYSETARLAAKDFDGFEHWMEAQVETLLLQSGYDKPHLLAQLCIACSLGIAKKAQRVEEIGPAIRFTVRKLLQE